MNEVQLKILDFGASLLLADTSDINTTEGLMGTPYYMSPEQAAGATLDQRTDLYSAAVVLYEAISGKLPHTADDVHSLVYSIATEEPTPISEHAPNLSRPYREFFERALARDPLHRFRPPRTCARRCAACRPGSPARTATPPSTSPRVTPAGSSSPTSPPRAPTPCRCGRSAPSARARRAPSRAAVPMPTARPPQPLAPRLLAASAAAIVLALVIQWARFGSPARAPVLDSMMLWAICAAGASVVAWRLGPRR
jgi:serine/threonine-protein kinase